MECVQSHTACWPLLREGPILRSCESPSLSPHVESIIPWTAGADRLKLELLCSAAV